MLKQPLEIDACTDKTVILLSGFGFGEQLKAELDAKLKEASQAYVQTITDYLNDINSRLGAEEQIDFDGMSFPEFPEQPQLYEEFSKLQLKHGVCISAYVQLIEE